MATKYTKIPRAISELKYFLDYNYDEYTDAAKHIKSGEGWAIPFYEEKMYSIVSNLEENLYSSIYPKLLDDNPTTDNEIVNNIKGFINHFSNDTSVFQKIVDEKIKTGEEAVLSFVEGKVEELLFKALYKFKEVEQLAQEDIQRSNTEDLLPLNPLNKEYIVGIVVATTDEFTEVKDSLSSVKMLPTTDNDSQVYYEGYIPKHPNKLKVIFTKCHHQGTASATVTTTKLILTFNPNIVVMLGHAAGNKNLMKNLNLGDILICSEVVDYGQIIISERMKDGEPIIIEKDRKMPIDADPTVLAKILDVATDNTTLKEISESYTNKELFEHELSYREGKMITGDALVRSETWFQKVIGDNVGTIGLDMETYGVYYAAKHTKFKNKPLYISMKSVSDFGSQNPNYPSGLKDPPGRVSYAIYTSVQFFLRFALKHLPI